MKNLLQIKNFKHRLGWLAAFVSLLFMSQGALATTYYVYGGTTNNPNSFTKLGSTSTTEYTITNSNFLQNTTSSAKALFVLFTTYDGTITSCDDPYNGHIKASSVEQSGSALSSVAVQEYYVNNVSCSSSSKQYKFLKYELAANTSVNSVTVTISSLSGSNPTTGKYTVSAGPSCEDIPVSCSVINGTTSSTNPQCIVAGNSASFTITPSDGFTMPSKVSYSGFSDDEIIISGTTVTINNIKSAGTLKVICLPESGCTYYIKYPWGGGSNWSWKELKDDDGDGVYTCEGAYGGTSCNINTSASDTGSEYYGSSISTVGSPSTGNNCIFSFTPKAGSCPIDEGTIIATKDPSLFTWYLAGEFTSWATSKVTFTGTGTTLTCSQVFNGQTDYTGCTESKGFKIVRGDSWLGVDCTSSSATVTKDNPMMMFDVTKTGNAQTCGFDTNGSGTYIFTLNVANPDYPVLTVTYPVSKILPIVRIGNKTTEDSETYDVTVSAYVARTGCDKIDPFTVYYSKSSFTTGSEEGVYSEEFEQTTTPTINTLYPLILDGGDLQDQGWGDGDYLFVRVSGTNGAGESELSDIDSIQFKCVKEFTVTDIEKNFTACETGHQFDISEMVTPTPDNVTVTATSASASDSDFKIKNGVATWSITGKETGTTYTYTFTFTRDGYPDASGTVTVNYTEIQPTGTIAITTPAVDGTNTSPWTAVELVATVTGDAFETVKWTVSPSGLLINNGYDKEEGTATAIFKGKAPSKATQLYTVTVQGLSSSCGASTAIRTFIVNKDEEDCTEE